MNNKLIDLKVTVLLLRVTASSKIFLFGTCFSPFQLCFGPFDATGDCSMQAGKTLISSYLQEF